jgi:transitional endoplasmic reticulum ATPase
MDQKTNNSLTVCEISTVQEDNSVVLLNPTKMQELQLFHGDTVIVKSKRGKDTVCIILPSPNVSDASIYLNKVSFMSLINQIMSNCFICFYFLFAWLSFIV